MGEKKGGKKKKVYEPSCKGDFYRCFYSPMLSSIQEGETIKPKCCNSTAFLASCLCIFTCAIVTCAAYIDDEYSCASCNQMCGGELDIDSVSDDSDAYD